MTKDKETLKEALSRLEKIAEELNTKEIDVEAGLEKFREGVKLIKFCRGELKEAENEFKKLKAELDSEADGNEEAEE
ncbi:MAG TPA: exodeoxyribonuclease VII small subunit [Candidatus Tyrphobacter sp.]|nr:exodeoxyribonuclease VII small subunit [Candidatus Tyrphobacter sp.]